jgi:hypothetical protein
MESSTKLLIVLLLFSTFSFSQLTNKSQFKDFTKEIKFPFDKKKDPSMKYPQLRVESGEAVVDLIQLQGLKVSYIIDYDKWQESTLTETDRDEDWYIELFIENTTKEDFFYENPNDIVATLKVPGERTYYDDLNGNELKISGGKCIFYAWMLEKENGKYVLPAGEYYEWDFVVNRDAESYLETWVQRRFRPLEISTKIPIGKARSYSQKHDLIAYQETTTKSEIQSVSYGNYSSATLKLPKKRAFLSTAYPKIISNHQFKMNGDYMVVHEDNSIRIELKKLNDYGRMEYRVTNLISSDLKMNNNVPIAEITISNSHRQEIHLMKKNNFAMQKLAAHGVYSKQFTVQLNPISGEYWVDNHKLVHRESFPRDYIPTNLKLRKIMGAKHVTKSNGSGSGPTNIYILYPLNSLSKYNPGMFYFEDAQKHEMFKGQIYRIELSETGTRKWITFDSDYNGHTYPPNKINKWLGEKPGLMKDRVNTIDAQSGETYYFIMVGDSYIKLHSITKSEWIEYIKNENMTWPDKPKVIQKR